MKTVIYFVSIVGFFGFTSFQDKDGWISLFDGKTLTNWKVGENANTFSVDSGMIIVHGHTAHLFYMGDVLNHNFKNFEFKIDAVSYTHLTLPTIYSV